MNAWIDTNWTAVIVAALVRIVVAAIWYAPGVFGRRWQEAGDLPAGAVRNPAAIALQALGSLVMAYLLAQVLGHFAVTNVGTGALVGGLIWLGFVATIMLPGVLFERRPMVFFYIYAGYQLVTLALMGGVIAAF